MISLTSYIFMKIQLDVGTKADLSFNLRHFWPMNHSDGRDYREKRIVISRFLTPYIPTCIFVWYMVLLVSSHFTLLIWTYIFRVPFWNSLYFPLEFIIFSCRIIIFYWFWHWTVKYNYILLLYFTVERNQFKNLSPSPYTAISGSQSN